MTANQPNPAQQASDEKDDGLAAFTEYFCRNYPGPDTIIGRPEWHAPKLFRAAKHAIEAARELTAAQGEMVADGTDPIAHVFRHPDGNLALGWYDKDAAKLGMKLYSCTPRWVLDENAAKATLSQPIEPQGAVVGEDAPQFPLSGPEPKWRDDIGCVIYELKAGRPEIALKNALHLQAIAMENE